uniref:RanBP2-type domain-containing protein n=1 Tax=Echinostoma caproni TaxID=27848 RepID=A0A183B8Y4_9TREM
LTKACGNINWARRTTCNVCNTPRVNTMGERTGYGGGYMERDKVVEYRKRGDSDDEFDEFGRKKKRFRKTSDDRKIEVPTVASTSTLLTTGSSSFRSEEDKVITRPNLSKYDIWAVIVFKSQAVDDSLLLEVFLYLNIMC